MTNPKRILLSIFFATAVAASYGCPAAGVGSSASKVGKVGKAGEAASLGKGGRVAVVAEAVRLAETTQPVQLKWLDRLGSADRFTPDEVVDAFVVTAEDEASFAGIYKRRPTFAELNSMRSRVSPTASTTAKSHEATRTSEGIKDFVAYLNESPSKIMIVIGHNQSGRFYFANGESMPLAEMAHMINKRNKRGVFLSCEANKYLPKGYPASTTRLTHEDALDILHDLSETLRAEKARIDNQANVIAPARKDLLHPRPAFLSERVFNIRDERVSELIQKTINSSERNEAVNRTVKRVAIAAASGGFVYYIVQLKANKEGQKQSQPEFYLPPEVWQKLLRSKTK